MESFDYTGGAFVTRFVQAAHRNFWKGSADNDVPVCTCACVVQF